MRFFEDDGGRQQAPPFNSPRSFSASAKKIDLTKRNEETHKPEAWQTAAWSFYDSIGELHFAFNLIGQILSQIRLYAAIVDDPESAPVRSSLFLEEFAREHEVWPDNTAELVSAADKVLYDLLVNSPGMGSGLLRELGINLSVSGECYLVREKQWTIASTDELKSNGAGQGYTIQRSRKTSTVTASKDDKLPDNTFVARIWRSHPRFSSDADSSMIGVLDSCEQLTLLTQAIRMMTRSRMNAGVIFVPDGLSAGIDDDNPQSIEDALIQAAVSPLEEESAATSVVPLILTGPAALGKELKKIDLGRPVDEQMVQLAEATLDRVLQGIDIPKNVVQGLSDVKFSNAIIIDDNLYKAHIEPLALMIVDALTTVYFRPALKKLHPQEDETLINRLVIWFDPSDIVTRPDKSTAANEGFDRNIISYQAWRSARGFTDYDKPTDDELLTRMALERTQIPPDIAAALIERLNPEYFASLRQAGQEEAGIPDDISSLLEGGGGEGSGMDELGAMFRSETNPAGGRTPPDEAMQGGEVQPGGNLPPREQP
jgi:hypothetical protein